MYRFSKRRGRKIVWGAGRRRADSFISPSLEGTLGEQAGTWQKGTRSEGGGDKKGGQELMLLLGREKKTTMERTWDWIARREKSYRP